MFLILLIDINKITRLTFMIDNFEEAGILELKRTHILVSES